MLLRLFYCNEGWCSVLINVSIKRDILVFVNNTVSNDTHIHIEKTYSRWGFIIQTTEILFFFFLPVCIMGIVAKRNLHCCICSVLLAFCFCALLMILKVCKPYAAGLVVNLVLYKALYSRLYQWRVATICTENAGNILPPQAGICLSGNV